MLHSTREITPQKSPIQKTHSSVEILHHLGPPSGSNKARPPPSPPEPHQPYGRPGMTQARYRTGVSHRRITRANLYRIAPPVWLPPWPHRTKTNVLGSGSRIHDFNMPRGSVQFMDRQPQIDRKRCQLHWTRAMVATH